MAIRGWTRTSLLDFPGHIASVIFYGGCDYRCPMCHNADLVLRPGMFPVVQEEVILAHLQRRRGKITGIVLTGGEPTLQHNLVSYIQQIRNLGVAVKLDSNGYHPQVLAELLDQELLDYVAMDVKAPPEKYALLAGLAEIDIERIIASMNLLADSGIAHEYRTTVVPKLLLPGDIPDMVRWMIDIDYSDTYDYYLQQFRGGHTLDDDLADLNPYPAETLREVREDVLDLMPKTRIRGI